MSRAGLLWERDTIYSLKRVGTRPAVPKEIISSGCIATHSIYLVGGFISNKRARTRASLWTTRDQRSAGAREENRAASKFGPLLRPRPSVFAASGSAEAGGGVVDAGDSLSAFRGAFRRAGREQGARDIDEALR